MNRERFNLIPLRERSKLPSIPWLEYQKKKYTGELAKNNAVICGKISKCVVIDVDSPELIQQLFNDWNTVLKKTLVVKTGSGGYHIYLKPRNDKYPDKMPLTNPRGQHIDIQSEGSYVVAPGSIHPNGNLYEIVSSTEEVDEIDLEGFLLSLKTFGFNTDGGGLKPFQEIAKGGISTGDRNNSAFKYAIMLLDVKRLNAETVWFELQEWNKTLKPPMDKRELETIFNSAVKKFMRNLSKDTEEEDKIEVKKMKDLSATDEGLLVTFDCYVAAMDEHRTITKKLTSQCPECKEKTTVTSNGYENPRTPRCKKDHVDMIPKEETRETEDVRTVLLQEMPEEVENNTPSRKTARLHDALARLVYSSSRRITLTGKFRSVKVKGKLENEIIIEVENFFFVDDTLDTMSTDEEIAEIKTEMNGEFFDNLATSYAPDIFGYEDIKKSILLFLVHGGNVRREDIHYFIIGNPSRGKSELIKWALKLVKGIYVNGRLTSGAGLAAGMVKLSTGNMVPATGPLTLYPFVIVDEFDKMKKDDRAACLESMEQRTVSLIKSGVVMTHRSDACILAAANPRFGTWQEDTTLSNNIGFESFLLSRFDLISGIIETSQIAKAKVAHHIVANATGEITPYMDTNKLKRYLNYCRSLKPILTAEAGKHIEDFFVKSSDFVESNNEEYLPMETRQLEGLIRLSTAHAKLRCKELVEVSDVDAIILLYIASLHSFGLKTDESSVQSVLTSQASSKEEAFFMSINRVKNEIGHFTMQDVLIAMKETKFFDSVLKARDYFLRMEMNSRLVLNSDGSYKVPKN